MQPAFSEMLGDDAEVQLSRSACAHRSGALLVISDGKSAHDVMLLPSDNASKTYRVFTR